MIDDPGYSRFMPEMAELPELADASPDKLRRQNTLIKRMPALPSGAIPSKDLSFTDFRAQEAARYSRDVGAASDIMKPQAARSKAIAKAKNYQAQKAAERSSKEAHKARRSMVGRTKRSQKSFHLNFARQMGLGTDLYR